MPKDYKGTLPEFPVLRPVSPQWVRKREGVFLHLQDELGLSDRAIEIPQDLAVALMLCDGTRSVSTINGALLLRGITMGESSLIDLLQQLDDALLLGNGKFVAESKKALKRFRQRPSRPMRHAGSVYPADKEELKSYISENIKQVKDSEVPDKPSGRLRGILSPHIDYARGFLTYAKLWAVAAEDLSKIERVIILGTDHIGSMGMITPTRQNYQTPFGIIPNDEECIDLIESNIDPEDLYTEELHHVTEHSIELALVWLHALMRENQFKLTAILCGSAHGFVSGDQKVEDFSKYHTFVAALSEYCADPRTLVMAAGDLAHVGPEFGDSEQYDEELLSTLSMEDHNSLAAVQSSDAERFLALSVQESDRRKICGLSPIYLMSKLIEGSKGISVGYDQCPADQQGGSVVSIAGTLLYG
jgi:AmmeMemoRadiSam system protein B|tara:strand:- start:3082 stop:4329 length:1248 start_codon:yes stop_codon:yes gene_type:complete